MKKQLPVILTITHSIIQIQKLENSRLYKYALFGFRGLFESSHYKFKFSIFQNFGETDRKIVKITHSPALKQIADDLAMAME